MESDGLPSLPAPFAQSLAAAVGPQAAFDTRRTAAAASFALSSPWPPAGDQPAAIAQLTSGLAAGLRDQVLLGVTGSGKTFTMAEVIARSGRPALILAPNKILAAQLYGEMRSFFPENAVEYFVSYYDYYQPEAYVVRSDTYIAKESTINEHIDLLRHSATRALFERKDVVVVASVSAIYGIGSPETYSQMTVLLTAGERIDRRSLARRFVELHYRRNDMTLTRGTFRMPGEVIEIYPSFYEDRAWRLSLFDDVIEEIYEFDPLTGERKARLEAVKLYANSHYVTPRPTLYQAVEQIRGDLAVRLEEFAQTGRLLEAQRLEQRTLFDLEMIEATGACAGIENYSRYLTGRAPGEPPPTLFEYLPAGSIHFVDESHVTTGQLRGMYRGDQARKSVLSEHGFRLPSCLDNRPLSFEEWERLRPQTIYVSATPGPFEQQQAQTHIAEQVVRPTGLLDPPCTVLPAINQVDDVIAQVRQTIAAGLRCLITVLTKRLAEDLSEYLHEAGLRSRYLHAEIDTLERIEIIRDLRLGVFDVLVGINLLREGLDLPECGLVCILDADKEGYLRSTSSLIQTMGRAARNIDGRVILYADEETKSMRAALSEAQRRRARQQAYNEAHGITPETVRRDVDDIMASAYAADHVTVPLTNQAGRSGAADINPKHIAKLRKKMHAAAAELDFEQAARLRDEVLALERGELGVAKGRVARRGGSRFAPGTPALGRGRVRGKGRASRHL